MTPEEFHASDTPEIASLRFRLWRNLWVQGHCFEKKHRAEITEQEAQWIMELAIEEQSELLAMAERLGFTGKPEWLNEYALANLHRTRTAQLRSLETNVNPTPTKAP